LTALFLLSLYIAQCRKTGTAETFRPLLKALSHLPVAISSVLDEAAQVEKVAHELSKKQDFLYLGRHLNYPIALEGRSSLRKYPISMPKAIRRGK